MKKLLISLVLLSTSAKAELGLDQIEYLRTTNLQKYEQFLSGEEIELNVGELSMLTLKANIDTYHELINLKPISYEDVSEFMTYENYIDFLPRYIEYCKYSKKWKKYTHDISQAILLGSVMGMINYRKQFPEQEPLTIKTFLKNACQTALLSMVLEITTRILLNQFKHKKEMQKCTAKIKNMRRYEIVINKKQALYASMPEGINIVITSIRPGMQNAVREVLHSFMDKNEAELVLTSKKPLVIKPYDPGIAQELSKAGAEITMTNTLSADMKIIMQQYTM